MNVGSILDIANNITKTIAQQYKLSLSQSCKPDKLDPSQNVFQNESNSMQNQSTVSANPATIHDIVRKSTHTQPECSEKCKHILFMNNQVGTVMEMSYNCTEKVHQLVEKASFEKITNLTDSLTKFVDNPRDILSVCLSIIVLYITRKRLL